jgi:IS30 family transposase
MNYHQLAPEERYMLAALRRHGLNQSQIARALGHHRSNVCREVRRNSTRADGHYRGCVRLWLHALLQRATY